jgi:hypothetical protein
MKKFTRKDFLETLFQDYFRTREGFIIVRTVRSLDLKVSTRYFPNVELLSKETYSEDQHVFFGCCPRESMKPGKQYIKYAVALWAGLDLGPEGHSGKQVYFYGQPQAAKAVRSFPLPPSIIVESGWGLHLYWLLREVTPITNVDEFDSLLTALSDYFQCKTGSTADALLRLPDTVNCKIPSHHVNCGVKYINQDFRYDIQDFLSLNLGGASRPTKAVMFMGGAITTTEMAEVAKAEAECSYVDTPEDDELIEAVAYGSDGEHPDRSPDFEPVPYEDAEETQSGESSYENLADRIADKVVDQVSGRLMKPLADAIAERIIKHLDEKLKTRS